ncbi:unnamed protein product [Periconia digitata]|uniref:Uncharacterized protein n=1 Tax=Periconia digitata TaxID=1303443 RepID=A0A9W4UA70_9PLEO|nr:unnamed protein product [Periconia digitata]
MSTSAHSIFRLPRGRLLAALPPTRSTKFRATYHEQYNVTCPSLHRRHGLPDRRYLHHIAIRYSTDDKEALKDRPESALTLENELRKSRQRDADEFIFEHFPAPPGHAFVSTGNQYMIRKCAELAPKVFHVYSLYRWPTFAKRVGLYVPTEYKELVQVMYDEKRHQLEQILTFQTNKRYPGMSAEERSKFIDHVVSETIEQVSPRGFARLSPAKALDYILEKFTPYPSLLAKGEKGNGKAIERTLNDAEKILARWCLTREQREKRNFWARHKKEQQ